LWQFLGISASTENLKPKHFFKHDENKHDFIGREIHMTANSSGSTMIYYYPWFYTGGRIDYKNYTRFQNYATKPDNNLS
jgi:hypothetical protein